MSDQWLRYCRLVVATDSSNKVAVNLSEFRIKFTISQTVARKPSTAEIIVYNVSPETVNSIKIPLNTVRDSNRLIVILEAGYQDGHGQIFKGELWWKTVGRESQTDTYMKLVASIGDRACNYAVVSTSLPAGASQKSVFDKATETLKQNGVSVPKSPDLMASVLPRGKVIYQPLKNLLNNLADSNNFEFGFTDEGLATVPKDGSKKSTDEVVVLSADTGLIGRPVITPDGIEVKALLNPRLKIGALLQIDNSLINRQTFDTSFGLGNRDEATDSMLDSNGLYRIISREHIGDTRGTDWYTTMKCEGVNAVIKPITPTVANFGAN